MLTACFTSVGNWDHVKHLFSDTQDTNVINSPHHMHTNMSNTLSINANDTNDSEKADNSERHTNEGGEASYLN